MWYEKFICNEKGKARITRKWNLGIEKEELFAIMGWDEWELLLKIRRDKGMSLQRLFFFFLTELNSCFLLFVQSQKH